MSEQKTPTFKNRFLRRWLPTIVSLAALAAVIVYLGRSKLFDRLDLSHPQWGWLAALVVLQAFSMAVIGYSEALYVRHLGANLTFVEWFGLNVTSTVVNLVTPIAGGAVLRAGYYQWQHKLHPARFTPLLAANSLITYLVSGLLGLAVLGVFLLAGLGPTVSWIAPLICVVLIAAPLVMFVIPVERLPLPKGRIANLLRLALDGWADIRTSPSLLVRQVGLVVVLEVLQSAAMIVSVLGLGQPAPLLPLIFLGIVLSAWRVTPAFGIGGKEVIATLAAPLVGLDWTLGLLGSLAGRLANWVCVFTLGPLFSYLLTRRVGVSLSEISAAGKSDIVPTE